jgi:hypothetical protein
MGKAADKIKALAQAGKATPTAPTPGRAVVVVPVKR